MLSHPPIQVSDFERHVQLMLAHDGILFAQEYESIEPGQQYMCENSELEVNKPKNRYENVLAYDHSRVILRSMDGGPAAAGIDYINANFVDGFRKQNAYIATQGPLPTTFTDFWKMLWEQRSSAIVMMTRVEENHKVRCHQYWPDKGSQMYGPFTVTLQDIVELAHYTIRTFVVSTREVQQFQFTSWPENGVPDNPMPLLLFMRRAKFLITPDSGPVIVNCSAGCGRSGVYIVVDSMLDRIKHSRTFDVYGHVTCLRCQRNYMVQTEDQYVFIHRALLAAVKYGNTEVPTRNFRSHYERLTRRMSAVGNLVYTDAAYVDSYMFQKSYILASSPHRETIENFWKMILNSKCQHIVTISDADDEKDDSICYWPLDRPLRFARFVVEFIDEYNKIDYFVRQFTVTVVETGLTVIVKQLHVTTWNERCLLAVAKEVQKIRQHKSKLNVTPITIHCSDGWGKSGVVATLLTIIERLQFEGVVDIFQTVYMARHQKPGFIANEVMLLSFLFYKSIIA
ncbi:hypothetical protein HELRODRAFT_157165 [Helobdella robusta]|uniref:Protein-tyrosine-phosphatase n=1 Tax=Helobdella robusta TaxID=6412 RepID=T1EM74_HELRO|nr:hypothetical protein HELRODRAFT_157165 [Helobdella robusta]ESO02753.1 hypothetical protein HELRODRAFT_157165 [Helobdella robusta]